MARQKRPHTQPRVSKDPRNDMKYMALVDTFCDQLREWFREEHLTVAEASRRSSVSATAIARILNEGNDWTKRTMAPQMWTMYRLASAADIGIKFKRSMRRRKRAPAPHGMRKTKRTRRPSSL